MRRGSRFLVAAALVGQVFNQADAVVDRLAGSIAARCVELCPDDALDAIGATCNLPRAVGESDADYRAWLDGKLTELHHTLKQDSAARAAQAVLEVAEHG